MSDHTPESESAKLHGDKLEPTGEATAHPQHSGPHRDKLEAPIDENPQTDGGAKIHGDKLEDAGR